MVANATMQQGAKATNPMTINPSLGYTENMKLSVETRFLNANKIMSPSQKRQVLSYNISNSDKRVGSTLQGGIQEKFLLFSWILTFSKVSHSKEWVKAYRMVGKGATNPMTTYPSLGYTENMKLSVETRFLNANKIMSSSRKGRTYLIIIVTLVKSWIHPSRVCYVRGARLIHNCNESLKGFQNYIKSNQFNCSDLITSLIELLNIVQKNKNHI